MRHSIRWAVLALATIALAATAGAQPAPRSFEGELRLCPNHHRVELEAGRRYAISVTSQAFDPVVMIYRQGTDSPLAENDDGGEGTDSLVHFTPEESGDYRVCVSSFGGRSTGAYRVGVEAAGPMPEPTVEPTRTETLTRRVYEGALEEDDPRDGGVRFDDYLIRLEAGQRALIGVESDAFDPVVRLYSGARAEGEEVASDDDGGGGLDSFLVFDAEQTGPYVVRVTAYSSGTGAYRVTVQD